MTDRDDPLVARLEAVRRDLEIADTEARADLIETLDDIVLTLQAQSRAVPAWALATLRDAKDDGDGFDNLPI